MNIQGIDLGTNVNNGTTPTTNSTPTGSYDSMDLNDIYQQTYEAEMAKYQPEIDAARARVEAAQKLAEEAQAKVNATSTGSITSVVTYTPEQIQALQQQALTTLQQQAEATQQAQAQQAQAAQASYLQQQKLSYPSAQAVYDYNNPEVQTGWENNITGIQTNPQTGWENASAQSNGVATAGGFVMPTGAQKEIVYKIIAAEGGSRSPQEAVNIASTMINRARSGRWGGGNDIYKLATAKNQYVVYQTGRYKTAGLTAESRAALDQLFANAAAGGSTAHNYQSFRSNNSTSYGGTILTPGGNRYK